MFGATRHTPIPRIDGQARSGVGAGNRRRVRRPRREHDGRAENIWKAGDPDGPELLKRLKALPGFGEQKAKIFLALLGKQYGVQPKDWRKAAGNYGEKGTHLSVADVVDAESLGLVRAHKKEMKAAAKAKAAKA